MNEMKKSKIKTILILLIIIVLCLSVGVYAGYTLSATDVTYTKPGETTPISVKDALDELRSGLPTKSIGDEVSLKNYPNEKFYVLEWDNNSDTVNLIAKYNLNSDGNAQSSTEVDCKFSSTNYWSSEASYPLNLNDYYGYSSNDALAKAKNYGRSKGAVSSRLLSYEEVNALEKKSSSNSKIKSMFATGQSYWLGSARGTGSVWFVDDTGGLDYGNCRSSYLAGFRPVVTVLKSSIS